MPFIIGSFAELVQVNNRLMRDITYPMQPPLPPLPKIVSTTFLQTSAWTLAQHILANPPQIGMACGKWVLTPPIAFTGERLYDEMSVSKLHGKAFIGQQLRAVKCMYHMPTVVGEQVERHEWIHTI